MADSILFSYIVNIDSFHSHKQHEINIYISDIVKLTQTFEGIFNEYIGKRLTSIIKDKLGCEMDTIFLSIIPQAAQFLSFTIDEVEGHIRILPKNDLTTDLFYYLYKSNSNLVRAVLNPFIQSRRGINYDDIIIDEVEYEPPISHGNLHIMDIDEDDLINIQSSCGNWIIDYDIYNSGEKSQFGDLMKDSKGNKYIRLKSGDIIKVVNDKICKNSILTKNDIKNMTLISRLNDHKIREGIF